jgi:hypothetical protein
MSRVSLGSATLIALLASGCGPNDTTDLFSSGSGSGGGGESAAGGAGGGSGGSATGGSATGGSSTGGSSTGGGATGGSSTGGGSVGGAGGEAGAGGGAGSGGGPVSDVGCADGEREAYLDEAAEPNIAACAGGFSVPGTVTAASLSPACGRQGGDDGANPAGSGCSVEDLCAAGWHVCESSADVASHAETGACPDFDLLADFQFYLTRQAQTPNGNECAAFGATNNVVGCGNMGDYLLFDPCAPLDRRLRWFDCSASATWSCGADNSASQLEAELVVKSGAPQGGVLCCRD